MLRSTVDSFLWWVSLPKSVMIMFPWEWDFARLCWCGCETSRDCVDVGVRLRENVLMWEWDLRENVSDVGVRLRESCVWCGSESSREMWVDVGVRLREIVLMWEWDFARLCWCGSETSRDCVDVGVRLREIGRYLTHCPTLRSLNLTSTSQCPLQSCKSQIPPSSFFKFTLPELYGDSEILWVFKNTSQE